MKLLLLILTMGLLMTGCSDKTQEEIERMGEKTADQVEETSEDIQRSAKKTARDIKDKTCEWINGKLECKAKKLKHDAEDAIDKVKDYSE